MAAFTDLVGDADLTVAVDAFERFVAGDHLTAYDTEFLLHEHGIRAEKDGEQRFRWMLASILKADDGDHYRFEVSLSHPVSEGLDDAEPQDHVSECDAGDPTGPYFDQIRSSRAFQLLAESRPESAEVGLQHH